MAAVAQDGIADRTKSRLVACFEAREIAATCRHTFRESLAQFRFGQKVSASHKLQGLRAICCKRADQRRLIEPHAFAAERPNVRYSE
jgi:hypothetical protein